MFINNIKLDTHKKFKELFIYLAREYNTTLEEIIFEAFGFNELLIKDLEGNLKFNNNFPKKYLGNYIIHFDDDLDRTGDIKIRYVYKIEQPIEADSFLSELKILEGEFSLLNEIYSQIFYPKTKQYLEDLENFDLNRYQFLYKRIKNLKGEL